MIKTRLATKRDTGAISDMLGASYGVLLKDDYPQQVLAAALPHMTAVPEVLIESNSYFIALMDSRIIGAGGWMKSAPGDGVIEPGRANVRKVGVHPDYLRCGVGTALITRIHTSARDAGNTWMQCLSSVTAEPFYKSHGYQRGKTVAIETGITGQSFKSTEMRLVL